jgi:hypothetical protein
VAERKTPTVLSDFYYTFGQPESWVQMDLGPTLGIQPQMHSLQHVLCGDSLIRKWRLEGSVDGKKWDTLSEFVAGLEKCFCTRAVQPRAPGLEPWPFYRFLRWWQSVGPDAEVFAPNHTLVFPHVEVYGSVRVLPSAPSSIDSSLDI